MSVSLPNVVDRPDVVSIPRSEGGLEVPKAHIAEGLNRPWEKNRKAVGVED